MQDSTEQRKGTKNNPRWHNGHRRKKNRARLRAMGLPCALCGRPIDYDAPSDAHHPYSFVIDEDKPISRYREFGYKSKAAAADDFTNLQALHYRCNQLKGTRTIEEYRRLMARGNCFDAADGEW